MAVDQSANAVEPPVAAELRALAQQAQAGDAAALPRIREILDHNPEIWRHVGDLTVLVEHAWCAFLSGDDPVAAEAMRRVVGEMKADLAGEHPTRLESLLVDQVVATWLEVRHMESLLTSPARMTVKQDAGELKRLESAQRRYASAIKALAEIRTLMPMGLAPSASIRLHDPHATTA